VTFPDGTIVRELIGSLRAKKYVGAFWDGDFNGHGTLTFSSGKLLRND